jgi:hypothetical protein
MITNEQIKAQSLSAYNQWCVQWREQAKMHSKFKMKPFTDFANGGIGRACLLVANGYSLEKEIETIKKHQAFVDILVCDKAMGHLLDNGIVPTYVMLCDANVSFEKYCEKWKDKLEGTILFANVCSNPKWTHNVKWRDIYFFANEDILKSEKEFMKLSGCPNKIPAATNVSNAMVVMMSQSDNQGRKNYFGYDKYLLIGYDYSWGPHGNYYAFDRDGNGKACYMKHHHIYDLGGNPCYTSNNLLFSAQWLEKYIKTFHLPIVQCSENSILFVSDPKPLEKQMQYSFKRHDKDLVNSAINRKMTLEKELREIDMKLLRISEEHYNEAFK